jgi:hypothetical protein
VFVLCSSGRTKALLGKFTTAVVPRKMKEDKDLAQESESKVDVYFPRRVQLIPRNPAAVGSKPSRASAEKKRKQADEPIYIDRI